jgi:RimJ/RimL family protein N-acetyltransferase
MVNFQQYSIFPLTPDRWGDFQTLFGERGAYSGCWCMYWRIKRSEFNQATRDERKAAMHALINQGTMPGILLYEGSSPIGWCSIGPREDFPPLQRSTTLKPVDDQEVWSIVCFFINKKQRRQGMMTRLICGAIDFAQSQGAKIIEAYPTDMQTPDLENKNLTGYHGFMGIASAFRKIGFKEVGRASNHQLIMRYVISD